LRGPIRDPIRGARRTGARADRVGGRWDGPRGPALLIAVRVRAVDGAANRAVVTALATAFDLPRSAVAIRVGERSRDKLVDLDGDPAALTTRLNRLLG
jgi:uncharacterized protein YggU (UPF0235/DUF167 family)